MVGHLLKIMKMLIYTSETASLVEVSILAFIKPVLQALKCYFSYIADTVCSPVRTICIKFALIMCAYLLNSFKVDFWL